MQYGFICVPSVRSTDILTQVCTPDTGLGTLSYHVLIHVKEAPGRVQKLMRPYLAMVGRPRQDWRQLTSTELLQTSRPLDNGTNHLSTVRLKCKVLHMMT